MSQAPTRCVAVLIEVCCFCRKPWKDHLPSAHARLKADQPERVFLGSDGLEYPRVDSYNVQNYVSTLDCPAEEEK